MASVDLDATPTDTAAAGETDKSPIESVWDCVKMKNIVCPITNKAKME